MKNILLVVDVQVGFNSSPMTEQCTKQLEQLLERNLFDLVLASKYFNTKDSNISQLMGWKKLCTEEEQQLVPSIERFVDDVVVKKLYSSATEELLRILKNIGGGNLPDHIFIVGFDTECCVLATATDLFELGVKPYVLTQYCASSGGERFHDAGLVTLEHLIGEPYLIRDQIVHPSDLNRILSKASDA